jgi:hypothetical protein
MRKPSAVDDWVWREVLETRRISITKYREALEEATQRVQAGDRSSARGVLDAKRKLALWEAMSRERLVEFALILQVKAPQSVRSRRIKQPAG